MPQFFAGATHMGPDFLHDIGKTTLNPYLDGMEFRVGRHGPPTYLGPAFVLS